MDLSIAVRASRRIPLLQLVKSAVATIIAWLLAGWLIPGPLPVFAAIAALLVVQPSLNQSFAKAIERSIGVIAGVVVASVLGLWLGSTTWVIVLAIAASLALAWALRLTPGALNQVTISAILVLALGVTTPGYAVDRVIETIIGAIVGVAINILLVPPVLLGPARDRVDALGAETAASLERLAAAFLEQRTPAELEELLLSARLLKPMREAAAEAIDTAADSLTLNPRARRYRPALDELEQRLGRFSGMVIQVGGMTRALYDYYDPTLSSEPAVRAIAEQLRRAAHDVRLLVPADAAVDPGAVDASPDPALTAPLTIRSPSAANWMLLGSVLVDLHRIHLELSEANAERRR